MSDLLRKNEQKQKQKMKMKKKWQRGGNKSESWHQIFEYFFMRVCLVNETNHLQLIQKLKLWNFMYEYTPMIAW